MVFLSRTCNICNNKRAQLVAIVITARSSRGGFGEWTSMAARCTIDSSTISNNTATTVVLEFGHPSISRYCRFDHFANIGMASGGITTSIARSDVTAQHQYRPGDGGRDSIGWRRANQEKLKVYSSIMAGNSSGDVNKAPKGFTSDGYNIIGTGTGCCSFQPAWRPSRRDQPDARPARR